LIAFKQAAESEAPNQNGNQTIIILKDVDTVLVGSSEIQFHQKKFRTI
jgi:hypothetical protein